MSLQDDIINAIKQFKLEHRFEFYGIIAGFIIGVLIIAIGLWKTVILGFFVWLGYYIGSLKDKDKI